MNGTSLDSESSETPPDGEVSEKSPLLSNRDRDRDRDAATHRSCAEEQPVEVSVNKKGKFRVFVRQCRVLVL